MDYIVVSCLIDNDKMIKNAMVYIKVCISYFKLSAVNNKKNHYKIINIQLRKGRCSFWHVSRRLGDQISYIEKLKDLINAKKHCILSSIKSIKVGFKLKKKQFMKNLI